MSIAKSKEQRLLKIAVDHMKARVAGFQATIAAKDAEIAELQCKLSTARMTIVDLEDKVVGLKANLNDVYGPIAFNPAPNAAAPMQPGKVYTGVATHVGWSRPDFIEDT